MELMENAACSRLDAREAVLSGWYDAYGTDVLRLCCFYLGNRADAEDALQETYLKAWRHMDRFQGRNQCSVKTWLLKIACNVCRDQLRRACRKREVTLDERLMLQTECQEDRELMLDVTRLPEKLKAAILLTYLQRMNVRETAAALRVSPSTVSRRLEKARKMLLEE